MQYSHLQWFCLRKTVSVPCAGTVKTELSRNEDTSWLSPALYAGSHVRARFPTLTINQKGSNLPRRLIMLQNLLLPHGVAAMELERRTLLQILRAARLTRSPEPELADTAWDATQEERFRRNCRPACFPTFKFAKSPFGRG